MSCGCVRFHASLCCILFPSGVVFCVQPFVVAAASLCSLKDAVLSRWLGKDLEPYLLCLQQLASNISYLHSRRIILCDFAADTIYVEKNSEDNKLTKVRYQQGGGIQAGIKEKDSKIKLECICTVFLFSYTVNFIEVKILF